MTLFVLGFTLFGSPALAQDAGEEEPTAEEADLERARTLFENGRTLFEEGQYADAITAWEGAYELTKRPKLLFNIANAHERLGDYQESIDVLNRYRAFAEADEKAALERRLTNLERLAAEAEAKKAAAEQPVAPVPVPVAPVEPASGGIGTGRVIGLGLIGAGAVGIVGGAILGASSSGAGADAEALCVERDDGFICPTSAQEFLDKNRSQALGSDVLVGVGVASAVVGTVLVLSGNGKSVTVGANRIQFDGRF